MESKIFEFISSPTDAHIQIQYNDTQIMCEMYCSDPKINIQDEGLICIDDGDLDIAWNMHHINFARRDPRFPMTLEIPLSPSMHAQWIDVLTQVNEYLDTMNSFERYCAYTDAYAYAQTISYFAKHAPKNLTN